MTSLVTVVAPHTGQIVKNSLRVKPIVRNRIGRVAKLEFK